MLYWALFEGKTPFYKLWLSFDTKAELDLRLTKYFFIAVPTILTWQYQESALTVIQITSILFFRSKDHYEMSEDLQRHSDDTLSDDMHRTFDDDVRRSCDDSCKSSRDGHSCKSSRQVHSDNDSGCALEEYSWVPPGLKPEHVSNTSSIYSRLSKRLYS